MREILPVLLFAVILAIAAVATRRRPLAVVIVRDGKAELKAGKVPGRILSETADLCKQCNITKATISVYRRQGGCSLQFSSEVPREVHQMFRNLWSLHS